MKVTGSSIQQLDKLRRNGTPMPKSECRRWRLWATTEEGRKSRRFKGTWTQALEALRAFVSELEGFVPDSESFGSYAESWRLWRASMGELSPGTCENDRRNVAALRRTALDGLRLDELTPEACRDAIAWLKQHPVNLTSTGALTNTTMNKIVQTLKAITAQAHSDGRLANDPMERIAAPRPDTAERDAMSPVELSTFLDVVDTLPLDGRAMALYLMACLGLRRGEAMAVMDADIADGLCRIRYSVKERDNSLAEPKTKAGLRTLPVPPRLQRKVDEFREVRKMHTWRSDTLCCNTHGERMTVQPFQKWWKRTRVEIGYPGLTMHQLRHSNLSMMARHMSPFDLQAYAGWSSIAPAQVYVHRDLDAVRHAVSSAWDAL